MRSYLLGWLFAVANVLAIPASSLETRKGAIKPKVFIISESMPEAAVWWGIKDFNLLAQNITVPGFFPLFPQAYCTANGDVCQVVAGAGEINAATTISSLVASPSFDLTSTYFFIAGIAGINPDVATIAGVTFARYAVQVALQYEIDSREIPSNWATGYFAQGTTAPGQYPTILFGTEVFEVNDALKKVAVGLAKQAKLTDTAAAQAYRSHYVQATAKSSPSVVECDVATSDVWYSGTLLSQAFSDTVKLWTNGTGVYCSTAQEDNATLGALLRGAQHHLVDFSRIIVMRASGNFDRPYDGEDSVTNLLGLSLQGGFLPALANIQLAGLEVVNGILSDWDATFEGGVKPTNYIGDIFGTLGGTPDFGPGPLVLPALKKR